MTEFDADCTATDLDTLLSCLDCDGTPCPPGWVVWVDNDINVGLTRNIEIDAGITLAGDRGLGSLGNQVGPLIYTDAIFNGQPEGTDPIFRFTGDSARITGLRIHGYWGAFTCDFLKMFTPPNDPRNRSDGVLIWGTSGNLIDHNQIRGFRGAGVGAGQCGDTYILDNELEANRATGGSGYGVSVTEGCIPLIHNNTFDCNRHAIAGTGAPGSGYIAEYNTVTGNTRDQQFDMHDWCHDHGNCRNPGAGDLIIIRHNTFTDGSFPGKPAIWIRGIPRDGAIVDKNTFRRYQSCKGTLLDPGAIWQTEGAGDFLNPGPDGGICVGSNSCSGFNCRCLDEGYPPCESGDDDDGEIPLDSDL